MNKKKTDLFPVLQMCLNLKKTSSKSFKRMKIKI